MSSDLAQKGLSLIGGAASAAASVGGSLIPEPYETNIQNWYKALPYGFAFFDRLAASDDLSTATSTLYLPILPSNIRVTTHFATNVVTTLYGVVEEHSEVRYYDITISGTTGFAPRFVGEQGTGAKPTNSQQTGRSAFDGTTLSDTFGGFLPEITNTIEQVQDTITDIGNSLNGGPTNQTGISPAQSGYAAFHAFYKFLLKYKKDAAGTPTTSLLRRSTHPFQFLNYKDGVRYDCIPLSFNLERSAENPMLYNYSLQLRCYNLRSVNSTDNIEADQLARLGLGDVKGQSLFSSLTGAAGSAATLVSAVL